MCEKTKFMRKGIDPCLKNIVRHINEYMPCKTLSSCCGHGKYPPSIVVLENKGLRFDIFSDKEIPRKKRFYQRDKQGYYYIPEVVGVVRRES